MPGSEMPEPVSERPGERAPLSRERVLRGAVAVADAGGIGALTMRSLARRTRRQADVAVPLRREQRRDPRRHRRSGLQRDRAAVARRRLAVGDAPPGGLGPPVAAAPSLGDRAHGVASQPWPRDAAPPRRDPRHPARGRFLGGDDRPRLRPARQLHLRIRAAGGRPALQRPETVTEVAEAIMEQFPPASTPTSSRWRPSTSCGPATTSATSSSSGSAVILDALARSIPATAAASAHARSAARSRLVRSALTCHSRPQRPCRSCAQRISWACGREVAPRHPLKIRSGSKVD